MNEPEYIMTENVKRTENKFSDTKDPPSAKENTHQQTLPKKMLSQG
jgi:hypothetical protein